MLPLEGITVVSLEQAVAAPFATRQLADLGARVIKIERPKVGDFARGYDTTVRGMCSQFVWLNRSKESLTLDLKQPEAKLVLNCCSKKRMYSSRISRPERSSGSDSARRSCARNFRASSSAIFPDTDLRDLTAIKRRTIC